MSFDRSILEGLQKASRKAEDDAGAAMRRADRLAREAKDEAAKELNRTRDALIKSQPEVIRKMENAAVIGRAVMKKMLPEFGVISRRHYEQQDDSQAKWVLASMSSIRHVLSVDEDSVTFHCGDTFWAHTARAPLAVFSMSDRDIAKLVRTEIRRYKTVQKDVARAKILESIEGHEKAIAQLKSQL